MKHSQLRSIAHNLADSLASGISLMTGFYELDLYGDAARSPNGKLSIDILNGRVIDGNPSPHLVAAVARLGPEFIRLCEAEGISCNDCRDAKAFFYAEPVGSGFTLMIEDGRGRATETDYEGIPARRSLEIDTLGRVRRKAIRRL